MAPWTPFPYAVDYGFDAASVRKQWQQLHGGDAEPCPTDTAVLQVWAHFHNGQFEQAAAMGLSTGGPGITAANKATAIYANYLEPKEPTRLDLLLQVAERAEAQAVQEPSNANAWFWHAYALGRYSQGISVAKALAQGLGSKVKHALEKAIALSPLHADARIALGAYHAEVIDKVGELIGGMTHGAKKETGLQLFREALQINPRSAVGMIEYANAMMMLEGGKKMREATQLYEDAAALEPLDAREQLDVEMARAELRAA